MIKRYLTKIAKKGLLFLCITKIKYLKQYNFALMIHLLRKIQGPALEVPQRGRARLDPFYGAPEAPEATHPVC